MQLFYDERNIADFEGKYFYVDGDFLGVLFSNDEILSQILKLFSKGHFLLDPFIAFEFLRDIHMHDQRSLKEGFLEKLIEQGVLFHATPYKHVIDEIQNNALILSRIYKHQNMNSKPSLVDLFLSSRIMLQSSDSSFIITGNKKDFPSCVFDLTNVLSFDQGKDQSVRSFSVLKFNKDKFLDSHERLKRTKKSI